MLLSYLYLTGYEVCSNGSCFTVIQTSWNAINWLTAPEDNIEIIYLLQRISLFQMPATFQQFKQTEVQPGSEYLTYAPGISPAEITQCLSRSEKHGSSISVTLNIYNKHRCLSKILIPLFPNRSGYRRDGRQELCFSRSPIDFRLAQITHCTMLQLFNAPLQHSVKLVHRCNYRVICDRNYHRNIGDMLLGRYNFYVFCHGRKGRGFAGIWG